MIRSAFLLRYPYATQWNEGYGVLGVKEVINEFMMPVLKQFDSMLELYTSKMMGLVLPVVASFPPPCVPPHHG